MQPLTRNCFLGFATAGALALTVASTPSFAGDPPEVLGPVGPNDPIITQSAAKLCSPSTRRTAAIAACIS